MGECCVVLCCVVLCCVVLCCVVLCCVVLCCVVLCCVVLCCVVLCGTHDGDSVSGLGVNLVEERLYLLVLLTTVLGGATAAQTVSEDVSELLQTDGRLALRVRLLQLPKQSVQTVVVYLVLDLKRKKNKCKQTNK